MAANPPMRKPREMRSRGLVMLRCAGRQPRRASARRRIERSQGIDGQHGDDEPVVACSASASRRSRVYRERDGTHLRSSGCCTISAAGRDVHERRGAARGSRGGRDADGEQRRERKAHRDGGVEVCRAREAVRVEELIRRAQGAEAGFLEARQSLSGRTPGTRRGTRTRNDLMVSATRSAASIVESGRVVDG